MRGKILYIVVLLVIFLVGFMIYFATPKEFTWTSTYKHSDYNPLGCAVMDDVLSSSLKNGYDVDEKTFYQYYHEDSTKQRSFLIISDEFDLDIYKQPELISMLKKGSKLMIVSGYISNYLRDSISEINVFGYSPSVFHYNYEDYYSKDHIDTLITRGDDTKKFAVNSSFVNSHISLLPIRGKYYVEEENDTIVLRKDIKNTEDKSNDDDDDDASYESSENKETTDAKNYGFTYQVLMSSQYNSYDYGIKISGLGDGEIYVFCNPELMTNYNILDGNPDYIFYLMSFIDDKPVIRIESSMFYGHENDNVGNGISYILSVKPLKYAYYLLLFTVVLFMIFSSKRRQRIIPIRQKPINRMLEFTKFIGSFYYQKRNYQDLMDKKALFFSERIRMSCGIDIDWNNISLPFSNHLATRLGVDEAVLYKLLKDIVKYKNGTEIIDEYTMMDIANRINNILYNN